MAAFIMRGRGAAIGVASLFAIMAIILPFLSYMSGAVIALVTLRRGPIEGGIVVLATAAVVGVLSQYALDNPVFVLAFILAAWLPIWILSLILRHTVSLSLTLWVAAGMSLALLLLIHALIPEPTPWWREILAKVVGDALTQPDLGMAIQDVNDILDTMAKMMTGFVASVFFLSLVFGLVLGRWWQAMLYNPGGFRAEFLNIRLNRAVAGAGALVFLWAVWSKGGGDTMAGDLSTLVVTVFSVSGLALAHVWVEKTGANKFWLIGLYVLLSIIPPQIMAGLAVAAMGDAWFDIRKHFKSVPKR